MPRNAKLVADEDYEDYDDDYYDDDDYDYDDYDNTGAAARFQSSKKSSGSTNANSSSKGKSLGNKSSNGSTQVSSSTKGPTSSCRVFLSFRLSRCRCVLACRLVMNAIVFRLGLGQLSR